MLRRREHHVGHRYGFVKPTAELHDVTRFDERFVLDRNKVVNEDREFYAVTPLRFGHMLHVVRNAPGGAKRDDDIAGLHQPLETIAVEAHADEITCHRLEDREEETRMPDNQRQHAPEL